MLHIDDEPLLLAGFWACVLGGFVPLPLTTALSGGTLAGLHGLWRSEEAVWTVTSRERTGDDVHSPGAYRPLGAIEDLAAFDGAREYHCADQDDLALLLLTSGSTGTAKAVQLTHRNVLSRCVGAVTANGFDEQVRSFNWLPFDHVGGLIMFHFRDVYLRCRQVHAGMDWVLADPLRWLDAMSRHRSTMTWAPNFAFRLVNDQDDRITDQEWDLTSLVHIMNGGEPIYPGVLRRFVSVLAPFGLPPDAVHPGWGMSETSSGVVDCRFDPGAEATSQQSFAVGRPHPGVRLRIVATDDWPVPEGTIGLLQARGEPITPGYYNAVEQNRASFTEDGWFRTHDLAGIEHGALTVRGRVHDVIAIGGLQCHAHEIEAVVADLGVASCSYMLATAVRGPQDGAELAVFFHPRPGMPSGEGARRIAEEVSSRFGIQPRYVRPVHAADIRKTEIGKLRRPELRRMFEGGWMPARQGPGPAGPRPTERTAQCT